ncbi:tRNA (N6-threonylcarbamoyladenosine(37)-N6)-methyltransferase TrmO [Endozoicomonas sp. OPT23]|uniref:tRNA (N6-threonylcarbamoyladenosine(37)-N6)-methyltransferase TrmO n=1 Tax=Endozoicomonas sp. OPT23 TaxID=2072845 RepID=UPI001D2BD07D|nr:tRNA (N6-threonylcarbamoyladenosine(37)-N6)-methyltransferase TrmO [Endozoicomonas sp. OPT23]
MSNSPFQFDQIGIIHSCYRQKFGIPRQPGIVTAAEAELELLPPYNQENLVRGLEGFSHIWVHFIFHQTIDEGWRPTIRPPRLGGKQRVGVFATRSTHRPNPMGLSVVRLKSIESGNGKLILKLAEADLLDGTPVIDIKPYLPYADALPEAKGGFAPLPAVMAEVEFTEEAMAKCLSYEKRTGRSLVELVKQVLGQDPRPAYLRETTDRRHGSALWDVNVVWESKGDHFLVMDLEPYQQT